MAKPSGPAEFQWPNEPPIADDGLSWDTDRWLFGVANGVIDLRTGTLRRGQPADRVTLHTKVKFDPQAQCLRWEQFVMEVFDGDPEMIRYGQRAVGYSLTGDTREQCLFLCYGEGGKR